MKIDIKLSKNFTTQFNKLQSEFGDEMARMNGFSDGQISYTDFIDNFVDKQNGVSDAGIDGNANVNTKDICSLTTEMSKPHSKLIGFNKIYHELNKKYGFKTANEWLRNEWDGHFYLHDAASATFVPYCYLGQETVTYQFYDEIGNISLENLYQLDDSPEIWDEKLECYVKYPVALKVRDKDGWTKVTRILGHNNDNKMRHIKLANGASIIVTENHPIITKEGDVEAQYCEEGMEVWTKKPETYGKKGFYSKFDRKDYGYLVGMFLAEGSWNSNNPVIHQSMNSQSFQTIEYLLQKWNINYTIHEDRKFQLKVSDFTRFLRSFVKGQTSAEKTLSGEYLNFSPAFMDGLIAGVFDGDGNLEGYKNRHGIIRLTSRGLLNQLNYYLRFRRVFTRDRTPFRHQGAESFNSNLVMYGIGFSIGDNENYWLSIESDKIDNNYIPRIRNGNFKNKQYIDQYDYVEIISNTPYIDSVDFVYDITTESGHFICNDILSHNCFAYDLEGLVTKGLYFIDVFNHQPPQHLVTYTDFVGEFVSWTSNRSSGACGLPSFLIYSYYFWKKDVDSGYTSNPKTYRDQEFQRIIYKLNQPYLRVNQSAFTNFSIFDKSYLEALFGGKLFPNGEPIIDYLDEIVEYQKAFMVEVSKVREENVMTFPVLTFALLRKEGKFVHEEFARWASDHNMQWADSNFFISEDVTSLSNCCRLVSDVQNLGYFNSIGGTALEVGSLKVNTINLARLAYENETWGDYLSALKEKTILCMETLDVIRDIISRNIEKGLLPNYSNGIMNINSQYNTIGVIGIYEALQAYDLVIKDQFENTFYTDEGIRFATEIFKTLNSTKDEFAKDKDYQINIEEIPGERAAAVLMQKDKFLYPKQAYELPLYGNQWIPLGVKTTLQEKIRLSALLDKACNGGSIAHINLDAPFIDSEAAWKMLNYVADAGVVYFAFCTRISSCTNNHGFYGEVCPECGGDKTTTYQRIVGFLTRESSYSKERKAEFNMRDWLEIDRMSEI